MHFATGKKKPVCTALKMYLKTAESLLNQGMTYSQNSMTGERRPSASMQLPLRRSWAEERFSGDAEEKRLELVAADDGRAGWAVLRLWQVRRKSCVQLGVFQGCPQVAQGSGLVKE